MKFSVLRDPPVVGLPAGCLYTSRQYTRNNEDWSFNTPIPPCFLFSSVGSVEDVFLISNWSQDRTHMMNRRNANHLVVILFSIFACGIEAREFEYSANDVYFIRYCEAIVIEAHRRLGQKAIVFKAPSARALFMANEGITVGDPCRVKGIEKKFSNLIPVPTSPISMTAHIYSHSADFKVQSWKQLGAYQLGILLGDRYAIDGTKGIDVVQVHTNYQLLQMLVYKRIDLASIVTIDAERILRKNKIKEIKRLEPPIASFPIHIYLHKDYAALVPKLDRVIKQMKAEGWISRKIKEINEKDRLEGTL